MTARTFSLPRTAVVAVTVVVIFMPIANRYYERVRGYARA